MCKQCVSSQHTLRVAWTDLDRWLDKTWWSSITWSGSAWYCTRAPHDSCLDRTGSAGKQMMLHLVDAAVVGRPAPTTIWWSRPRRAKQSNHPAIVLAVVHNSHMRQIACCRKMSQTIGERRLQKKQCVQLWKRSLWYGLRKAPSNFSWVRPNTNT